MRGEKTVKEIRPLIGRIAESDIPVKIGDRIYISAGATINTMSKGDFVAPRSFSARVFLIRNGVSDKDVKSNLRVFWKGGGGEMVSADINEIVVRGYQEKRGRHHRPKTVALVAPPAVEPVTISAPVQVEIAQHQPLMQQAVASAPSKRAIQFFLSRTTSRHGGYFYLTSYAPKRNSHYDAPPTIDGKTLDQFTSGNWCYVADAGEIDCKLGMYKEHEIEALLQGKPLAEGYCRNLLTGEEFSIKDAVDILKTTHPELTQ